MIIKLTNVRWTENEDYVWEKEKVYRPDGKTCRKESIWNT
jgi:hypothetical protein